jgi:hypothetical protein
METRRADPISARPARAVPRPEAEPVLLGCHPGAGTSTLRVLLDAPWDLGAVRPDQVRVATFGRPLVLVTRDDAIEHAVEVTQRITGGGIPVAALVVVASGGAESPGAAAQLAALADRVGRVVRFPTVSRLQRTPLDEAAGVRLPKRARTALDDIRAACATPTAARAVALSAEGVFHPGPRP